MEPAGTRYGFTVWRKMSARSARHPSLSLRIFRHFPSPPVGTAAGKDWLHSTKTAGNRSLLWTASLAV